MQTRHEPIETDAFNPIIMAHFQKHILSWSQALDIGKETNEGHLDDRLIRVAINQCCTLVYTSGTSGCPKGIMLSHDNLTWSSKMVSPVKM